VHGLFRLGCIVLANLQFSLFGDFNLYFRGKKLDFIFFSISMEKCDFPAKIHHIHKLKKKINSGKINSMKSLLMNHNWVNIWFHLGKNFCWK
jgi:hypothetical protein